MVAMESVDVKDRNVVINQYCYLSAISQTYELRPHTV